MIAIENVRLFKELQARTERLTRSVGSAHGAGRGRAGDQLDARPGDGAQDDRRRARCSSPGSTAARSTSTTRRAQEFRLRAAEQLDEELLEALRGAPIRLGEGAVGRAAVTREPVQVPDIRRELPQRSCREPLVRRGYRALLAVPLLREEHIIGALPCQRQDAGRVRAGDRRRC